MSLIPLKEFESGSVSLLNKHRFPNLFDSIKWLKLLNREYSFEFFAVMDEDDFLIVARIEKFGFTKIKSLPFCDYTIPSVKSSDVFNRLIQKLQSHFPNKLIELDFLEPSTIPEMDGKYEVAKKAYVHRVNTGSHKVIDSNMNGAFLRGVRKAKKSGLNVNYSKSREALKTFYEIYHKMRINKFGKLPQPKSFFDSIWRDFINSGNGFVIEVKKESIVYASAVVLEHNGRWYYKFGTSRDNLLDERPNNLLFFELFGMACDKNISQVDLGLSGLSRQYRGLVRFKNYMGGIPQNIYSLRIEPENYNDKYETELKRFTSEVTRQIISQDPGIQSTDKFSRLLYKYFA
jgi:hypothetical protein